MSLKKIISTLRNEITHAVKDCIEHMQQAICEQQKAVAEKKQLAAIQAQQQAAQVQEQRKQILTHIYAMSLNTAFAEALNALPPYQCISPREIDPLSLRSLYNGSDWTITVNVPDGKDYTPAARKHLQEQLQLIFANSYRHTISRFCDYLTADSCEYCNILAASYDGYEATKAEAHFQRNYINFFNEMSHRLYRITINDIGATPSTLRIHYSVDDGALQHYQPKHYVYLRDSMINA